MVIAPSGKVLARDLTFQVRHMFCPDSSKLSVLPIYLPCTFPAFDIGNVIVLASSAKVLACDLIFQVCPFPGTAIGLPFFKLRAPHC